MSDVDAGAAPVAPAPEPAPAPSVPEKPSASPREAISRAFAKVDREEAPPPRPISSQTKPVEEKPEPVRESKPEKKAEPKAPEKPKTEPKTEVKPEKPVEAKPQQQRGPDGKFAPATAAEGEGAEAAPPSAASAPKPSAFPDAPKRFSTDAHSVWKDAPEPIRAEIHRAVKELEQGITKHKAAADEFETVRPFAELAKKQGTTLQAAMSRYVGMEQKLATDFIGGLEQICQNKGVSLRAVAAQIMGQKPDEAATRQDQIVGSLRNEIAALKQQIGGVTKTIEQQRNDAAGSQVEQFAKQPGHERFEELSSDIAFFLKSERASDLEAAYQLAERLNPAPASVAATPPEPAPAPKPEEDAAHTRKGTLGIHGAPSSGSDPATRKPPSSAREAAKRALAQVGMR